MKILLIDNTDNHLVRISNLFKNVINTKIDYTTSIIMVEDALKSSRYNAYFLYEDYTQSAAEVLKLLQLFKNPSPVILFGNGTQEKNAILLGADNYIHFDDFSAQHIIKTLKHAQDRKIIEQQNTDQFENQVEELKSTIEQQSKIIEGIRYARTIQDALLVKRKHLKELFGEFLIFYKPLNIVSGDFYFALERNGMKYLGVADCTGHGVPGALMSILCNDLLKRASKKYIYPHEILNRINHILQNEFKDEESLINDGMDISLIAIDRTTQTCHFASAHRPIIKISKEGELTEYKGDKVTIGIKTHTSHQKFSQRKFNYDLEDRIYQFSDGLQDQFGGEHDKKYSKSRLLNQLKNTINLSLIKQEKHIIDDFTQWQNFNEQIDDILILGICLR